jgi:hypothetical protein
MYSPLQPQSLEASTIQSKVSTVASEGEILGFDVTEAVNDHLTAHLLESDLFTRERVAEIMLLLAGESVPTADAILANLQNADAEE